MSTSQNEPSLAWLGFQMDLCNTHRSIDRSIYTWRRYNTLCFVSREEVLGEEGERGDLQFFTIAVCSRKVALIVVSLLFKGCSCFQENLESAATFP